MTELLEPTAPTAVNPRDTIIELLQTAGILPASLIEVMLAVVLDYTESAILVGLARQYADYRRLVLNQMADPGFVAVEYDRLLTRVHQLELEPHLSALQAQAMPIINGLVREGVLKILSDEAHDGSPLVTFGSNCPVTMVSALAPGVISPKKVGVQRGEWSDYRLNGLVAPPVTVSFDSVHPHRPYWIGRMRSSGTSPHGTA